MRTAQEIFNRYGKTYVAGDVIFNEGDIGEEMFIIQTGQVKITKKTNKEEKTLVILSEGDFFGEMAVIDREPRSAGATAITETRCIVLNGTVFESTMQSNIHIVKRILRNMSSRLREANKLIANLLLKDHNRRVANTLVLIAQKHGTQTENGMVMDFPLTINELASSSGLAGETDKVKDILIKLEKAKVIKFDGERIIILSLGNLDKFIQYLEMKEEFGG